MELRGFDSYPITLGDEMRGERASLGKSLDDVERDLLIKKRMIVAIETCDLEGFPNRSVVAGYVRAYARYLGMDPENAYHRFCAESGYQSPAAMIADRAGGPGRSGLPLLPGRGTGPDIALSRFAAPPARGRFMAAVPLGAITSAAALLMLMSGLAYGGWALLQDIQRVGFAPVASAPVVVAEAPLITTPAVAAADLPLPDPNDYRDGGILASVSAPAPLMPIEALRRDGPISAIDPRIAGVFAPGPVDEVQTAEAGTPQIDSADDAIRAAVLRIAESGDDAAVQAKAETPADAQPGTEPLLAALEAEDTIADAKSILLHASEEAWVRVRDSDNVIFEGILTAGQQYQLPPRIEAPVLKAGNAGGVFVVVDGVAYGPLGPRGQIARDVSLTPEAIRGSMPQAASLNLVSAPVEMHQSAEAATVQQ